MKRPSSFIEALESRIAPAGEDNLAIRANMAATSVNLHEV